MDRYMHPAKMDGRLDESVGGKRVRRASKELVIFGRASECREVM